MKIIVKIKFERILTNINCIWNKKNLQTNAAHFSNIKDYAMKLIFFLYIYVVLKKMFLSHFKK